MSAEVPAAKARHVLVWEYLLSIQMFSSAEFAKGGHGNVSLQFSQLQGEITAFFLVAWLLRLSCGFSSTSAGRPPIRVCS